MNNILTFLFCLIVTFEIKAQKSYEYIMVSPKYEYHFEEGEANYDNASAFEFFINDRERYEYENLVVSGYVMDSEGNYIESDHTVRIFTGWDFQFLEAQGELSNSGYFNMQISTDNLPSIRFVIGFMGYSRKIKLHDLTMKYINLKR